MRGTRTAAAGAVARWLTAWSIFGCVGVAVALDFPGREPGKAVARIENGSIVLENEAISARWTVREGSLTLQSLTNKLDGSVVQCDSTSWFRLALADSPSPDVRTYRSGDLKVVGFPQVVALSPTAGSPRGAEQCGGQQIVADLTAADTVHVRWQAELRDGSNYVRQTFLVQAPRGRRELRQIVPIELAASGAAVMGSVDGSPVVAGNWFFACEHPMSQSQLLDSAKPSPAGPLAPSAPRRFSCSLTCNRQSTAAAPIACSSVVGVVPAGQLRRAFLYYLERERAHPYRPLLHYNNGSEIGCEYWKRRLHGTAAEAEQFRRTQESLWIQNIEAFGRELVEKRRVRVDVFAHDFEWDDENLVWQFHNGYPQGFTPARRAAERWGARLGVWFSPWGGYPCQPGRVKSGAAQGFELNNSGLSLAGRRYGDRFRTACANMTLQYGVGYFKFDGFGAGNNQPGAGPYAADVEALLQLCGELRRLDPQAFINTSTGSWPSPFWLRWADVIWRQGSDTSVAGKGSPRQKWITYRDGEICHGTLDRGPLFPTSSLMIHGVFVNALPLFGDPYDPASVRPTYDPAEITQEIRSFFATGTALQELYVNPSRMTPSTWDALAEGALWARSNADVLVDSHRIGGDPAKGEVYGWASWTKRMGILALRNPDDRPAEITLDIGKAFELPAGASGKYVLASPWKADSGRPTIPVVAGRPHTLTLKPFEVLVFDALPEVN
jgi:hypothetical protein